jgi:hypothetical protein
MAERVPHADRPREFAGRDPIIGDPENLCTRCSGTGNELFSMYRRCSGCLGTGTVTLIGGEYRTGDVTIQGEFIEATEATDD